MSLFATLDGQYAADVASSGGWGDFLRWVDSLPVDGLEEVHHLAGYGWSQNLDALDGQLAAAQEHHAPDDPGVASTAQGLCDLLHQRGDAEVLIVGDGGDGDEEAASFAEGDWDESKHKRDGGKFAKTQGAAARTAPASDSRGGAAPDIEQHGDKACEQIRAAAGDLLNRIGAPGKFMRDLTAKVYGKLEERYGRKQALLIFGAGQALAWGVTAGGAAMGVPVWLPGSSLWGMAPFAAMAEVYHQAKRLRQHNEDGEPLDAQKITRMGAAVVKRLVADWQREHPESEGQQFAEDPQGGELPVIDAARLNDADFVTLPENVQGANCGNCEHNSGGVCQHPELQGQPVTDRNCCSRWDAPHTLRERTMRFAEDGKRRFSFRVQRGPTLKDFLGGEQVTGFVSSNVQAFEYDKPAQQLYVQFNDDRWYRYGNVTHHEAQGLYRANSKGSWVWDKLRVRGTVYGHRKPYALVANPASETSTFSEFAEGRTVKFAGDEWSPYTGPRGGKGWRSKSGKIIYGAHPPGGSRRTAAASTKTAPVTPKLRDMEQKVRSLMHGKIGARQEKALAAELANMTHADLQTLKTRLAMKGGVGRAGTAAKIAEQLRAPGHEAALAHAKHIVAKLPEGEREAALRGLLKKMDATGRARLAKAHGLSSDTSRRIAKHIAGKGKPAKQPAPAKAPPRPAAKPQPKQPAKAPEPELTKGAYDPAKETAAAKQHAIDTAAKQLRDLSDASIKPETSYAHIEKTVRDLAKAHTLPELKQIAQAFGVRAGLTSKPAITQKIIGAISERKGRHERGEEIGKVAGEGAMAGHPLAKAKSAGDVLKAINPGGGPLAQMDSPNPLGYDVRHFPKGVDGPAFVKAVQGAVGRQEAANPLKRLTLPEVYDAVKREQPGISYLDFQGALAKMQRDGQVRLGPYTQAVATHPEPRRLMPLDRELKWYVGPA